MRVCIDEAWQQREVAEVDDFGTGGHRLVWAHARDTPSAHHDDWILNRRSALHIDQSSCADHRRRSGCGPWLWLSAADRGCRMQGEHGRDNGTDMAGETDHKSPRAVREALRPN